MFHNQVRTHIPAVLIAALVIAGCAGSGNPVDRQTPVSPDLSAPKASPRAESNSSDRHSILGFWWIYIDPEDLSSEIVPAREPLMHVNVRKFLEDGVPCSQCLRIVNITPNPDGTKNLDIYIYHPWPGLDQFNGYDVRGIAMFNGSEVWPTSGLRTQDPDSTDGYVLNADGYTTIFNPTDFPPGWSAPIFSYSKGKMATATFPNSTLNPYKDYYTDIWHHYFQASQAAMRTWVMRFPSGKPFAIGYAVDASWEPPDFPGTPNMPEPYRVNVEQDGPLDTEVESEVSLSVNVWDWQMDAASAWVECPDLFDGIKQSTTSVAGTEYQTFFVTVQNEKGAPPGAYRSLVAATDSSTATPPWDWTTYTFYDITVADVGNHPPHAAAEADQYSVAVGETIQFLSLSDDPDGPGDIVLWLWDLQNDGTWDSIDVNPQWSYDEPGSYFVDHQVTDQGSLSDDLEPDELLHITVNDKCCANPPVAVIDGAKPVVTDEQLTLTSGSYDPDGIDCSLENSWDLDNDGIYEFSGDEAVVSFDQIGKHVVGLKTVDSCELEDTEQAEIDVHVGVTQPEDSAYKTIGTRYSYVSTDLTLQGAQFAVPLDNPAGPWDFTLLTLEDVGNYRAILGTDHPEVAPFKDDFVSAIDHFYKTEGIYNMVSGAVYAAEWYQTAPDRLAWVGIHEDVDLGSVNLIPPMEQDYPIWIFSSVDYSFGFPPVFEFTYRLIGWGEGKVSVPYNGLTDADCVVVKYEAAIVSTSLTGSALVYEWLLDDGTVVAITAAINFEGDENYDPDTWEVTGIATFNALNTVGPY